MFLYPYVFMPKIEIGCKGTAIGASSQYLKMVKSPENGHSG
jgi:hypothetical protein